MSDQVPDTRPGYYYVSVIDGNRSARVRGPFKDDHAAALAAVEASRKAAEKVDPRAVFYAFGTCRADRDLGPGFLDAIEASS